MKHGERRGTHQSLASRFISDDDALTKTTYDAAFQARNALSEPTEQFQSCSCHNCHLLTLFWRCQLQEEPKELRYTFWYLSCLPSSLSWPPFSHGSLYLSSPWSLQPFSGPNENVGFFQDRKLRTTTLQASQQVSILVLRVS